LKPPFRFATSGHKHTSPLVGTGNYETFEYEVGYAWLDTLGFGSTFLFDYSDAKTKAIFRLPSKFCNF
jgi:hypothetical protein